MTDTATSELERLRQDAAKVRYVWSLAAHEDLPKDIGPNMAERLLDGIDVALAHIKEMQSSDYFQQFVKRIEELEREKDKLGNALAQERAKPGGTFDQAEFAQWQDRAERADAELKSLRRYKEDTYGALGRAQAEVLRLREALTWLQFALGSWAVFNEQQPSAVGRSNEMRDILRRIAAALSEEPRDAPSN